MAYKSKSTKTDQDKAKKYLQRIKDRKGEVHWNGDDLGRTYDFEFDNDLWLCISRVKFDDRKTIDYTITTEVLNYKKPRNWKCLKTTNLIGEKIFNELKELYETTKKYPQ